MEIVELKPNSFVIVFESPELKIILCLGLVKCKALGTCQKLAGEERGWKTGEGHSFLSPSKGRIMKK